jgi:hypothetical protein
MSKKNTNGIPKVRMAKPSGRPFQLRYTAPETSKEIRITTGTHDEAETERERDKIVAKLTLGMDAKPKRKTRDQGILS